jgi:hypothetical protein
MVTIIFRPPLARQGEVSASYADGGVMSPDMKHPTPPSTYEVDTSPAKLSAKLGRKV